MSTIAWYYLGQSLLRLGELAAAEEAIAQANILDNTNPLVWGLNAVLCLMYGRHRLVQARFAIKEAFRLGLRDAALLEEIGDYFEGEELFTDGQQAYELAVEIDPENGTVLQKLGHLYSNDKNDDGDKERAVDCYKQAITLVKGDNNKQNIALTLQSLLTELNREFEISPFK